MANTLGAVAKPKGKVVTCEGQTGFQRIIFRRLSHPGKIPSSDSMVASNYGASQLKASGYFGNPVSRSVLSGDPNAPVHKTEWVLHSLDSVRALSKYVSRTASFERMDTSFALPGVFQEGLSHVFDHGRRQHPAYPGKYRGPGETRGPFMVRSCSRNTHHQKSGPSPWIRRVSHFRAGPGTEFHAAAILTSHRRRRHHHGYESLLGRWSLCPVTSGHVRARHPKSSEKRSGCRRRQRQAERGAGGRSSSQVHGRCTRSQAVSTTERKQRRSKAVNEEWNPNFPEFFFGSCHPKDGNQGIHRVTKRGPALSYPMFTLVTGDLGIVGRWRAVCVTALQRPNSDAAAIRIVVGIAAASLNSSAPSSPPSSPCVTVIPTSPQNTDASPGFSLPPTSPFPPPSSISPSQASPSPPAPSSLLSLSFADEELDLQRHSNGFSDGSSSKSRQFPCTICGKQFRFISILALHASTHKVRGARNQGRGGLKNFERNSQRPLFLEQQHGKEPISSDIQNATPDIIPEPVPLLSIPAPLPTLRHPCPFCKGKFRKAAELERHLRILHRPYKCHLCDFAASQEGELMGHVERRHSAPQLPKIVPPLPAPNPTPALPPAEFKCEVCSQSFTQSWFLKGHMRKHKDSFDHRCSVCGRCFKESWFLKNHMKVHLGKIKGVGGQEPTVHQQSQSPHVTTTNSPSSSSSRLLGYQNFYSGLLLRLPPPGDATCSQMLQATARAVQSGDGDQDGAGASARGQAMNAAIGEATSSKVMLPQGSSGIVLKTVGFPAVLRSALCERLRAQTHDIRLPLAAEQEPRVINISQPMPYASLTPA
ncbi:unnamed protein product [Ranitomeya imitator]|uniref:C2H2-type domain-containing protein n=1 Tax=Ranitomeya imitator TaxID=111125 RepID=A0ABN9M8T6_9NEOB|nr:unnamed protein product [Ranitomeya imitator]